MCLSPSILHCEGPKIGCQHEEIVKTYLRIAEFFRQFIKAGKKTEVIAEIFFQPDIPESCRIEKIKKQTDTC